MDARLIFPGFFPFPCLPEKSLDQRERLIPHDAGGHLAAMVQRRVGIEQIDPPSRRAALRIRAAENDALRTAVDDRTGTHRAGLLGDVEGAFFQPPVAEAVLGGGEGEHFRVGGGVLQRFHLIPGTGDDFPFPHDHAADRDLGGGIGLPRLPQGLAHEEVVAGEIDDRIHGGKEEGRRKKFQVPNSGAACLSWHLALPGSNSTVTA